MHVNSSGTSAGRNATRAAQCRTCDALSSTKSVEHSKTRTDIGDFAILCRIYFGGSMCELLGLSSNAPATVNFSLPTLAAHGRVPEHMLMVGASAFMRELDVRLIKEATGAGDSDLVQFIANHDLRSRLIIAHTRHATRGTRSYPNAQPFVRELAGRVISLRITGIFQAYSDRAIPGRAVQPDRGNGLRARLLCSPRPDGVDLDRAKSNADAARKISIVSSFANELRKLGTSEFLIFRWRYLFAHGHRRKHADTGKVEAPGLVFLQRQCQQDAIGIAASGLSIRGDPQLVALFASVPLTNEHWAPLAEGELVAACGGQLVARQLVDEALCVRHLF